MKLKIVKVEKRMRSVPPGWRRQEAREYNARARLYVHHVGESIMDNLLNRGSRPTDLYREIMPEIIRLAELHPDTKVFWSRTAGCGCGCSPGFVVKDHSRFDVWVDVEEILTTGEKGELAFACVETSEAYASGTE